MSINVKNDINEIKSIKETISHYRKEIKKLSNRTKSLEKNIIDFLNVNETNGVKHGQSAIVLENSVHNERKSVKKQRSDCVKLLSEKGVESPNEVYEAMRVSMKGNEMTHQKLKLKQLK